VCLFKKENRQQRSGIHDSNRLASWSLIFIEIFLLRKLPRSGGLVRHNEGEWERSGWKEQALKSIGRILADFAKPNDINGQFLKLLTWLKIHCPQKLSYDNSWFPDNRSHLNKHSNFKI